MKKLLKFEQFVLLEATLTVHFGDRLKERTDPNNVSLSLPESFWKNFENRESAELNIKNAIKKKVQENVYDLLAKNYQIGESTLTLVLDPKIEFEGKIYRPNLKVKSLDKKGQERIYTGIYWAVVFNNRLLTIFCKEDQGEDMLISDMKKHIMREDPEVYPNIESFNVDKKTTESDYTIKVLKNGDVYEEEIKHVNINTREFQTVIKPGAELTYYGFGPDKNLVKKTATIEAMSRMDGRPIDFSKESDVSPGIKIFFTNKASKTFIPNKDAIVINDKKAEITRIFLDKRMANPLNFMVKVRE